MTHTTHPSDEHPYQRPDDLIERALHSLRAAQPHSGLEARIAARLAQAAEAHTATSRFPFLAVILSTAQTPRTLLAPVPLYTLAATFLMTVSFFAFHRHPNTATIDHSATQPLAPSNQPSSPAQTPTVATTLVSQGFSLGSHRIQKEGGALAPAASPDALALAETLAPSRPAPPRPLTAQEHLLLLSTRQGQPIELATLDTLRQPTLQAAAEARQRDRIRRYAQSLLGPLAVAETVNPTSPTTADDTPTSQQPTSK